MSLEVIAGAYVITSVVYTSYRIIRGVLKTSQSPQENKKQPYILSFDPADREFGDIPDMFCPIAGAGHHCTEKDKGAFIGTILPEPNNPHDKNAHAIVRDSDGKLVGYIPRTDLKEYKEIAMGEPRKCIGFIRGDAGKTIFGKIKILPGTNNRMLIEALRFTRWMVENLGRLYIPSEIQIPPKIKAGTNTVLKEYLSEQISAYASLYDNYLTDDE